MWFSSIISASGFCLCFSKLLYPVVVFDGDLLFSYFSLLHNIGFSVHLNPLYSENAFYSLSTEKHSEYIWKAALLEI